MQKFIRESSTLFHPEIIELTLEYSVCKCQALQVGSYRCVKECSEGYRLVNGSCIDIDECSEKLAECDKRASCTNTIGGYKCTCEEGFAGNGRTCSRKAFIGVLKAMFVFNVHPNDY